MTRWIIGWEATHFCIKYWIEYFCQRKPIAWRPIYATPHPQHIRIDMPATSPRWWMLAFLLLIWLANWISLEFRS